MGMGARTYVGVPEVKDWVRRMVERVSDTKALAQRLVERPCAVVEVMAMKVVRLREERVSFMVMFGSKSDGL